MLIIVEYGDIKKFSQACLNLKTTRRRNIFEVNTSIGGSDKLNCTDNLINILGIEADWPCINICKTLKQNCLSLHHGKCSRGADISKAQNRRSVSYYSDGIAFHGQSTNIRWIFNNRLTDSSNTRCVGARKVVTSFERDL